MTRNSLGSPWLSSASIWCKVRNPSRVSSLLRRGKFCSTTFHSSSATSSPLVRQLNRLNSALEKRECFFLNANFLQHNMSAKCEYFSTWKATHCCPSRPDHRCLAALLEIVWKDGFLDSSRPKGAPVEGLIFVFVVEHLML